MREPKSSRQEVPQTPICNLNVALPDNITPEPAVPTEVDLEAIQNKYAFLREAGYGKPKFFFYRAVVVMQQKITRLMILRSWV